MSTIAAVATPQGFGGIGVVRISGSEALSIAQNLTGLDPQPRYAHFTHFKAAQGDIIDSGILLYFPAPHSFTGEAVIELQAHGGPIVLNQILQRVFALGAKPAEAGAFARRAFENDKLSLDQAEAIMSLIHAGSEQAARAARQTLQGAFANDIHTLVDNIHQLRIWVEAAIDFPEEEVDFLSDHTLQERFESIITTLKHLYTTSQTGKQLTEGVMVAIVGEPNVGKSSLLNALVEQETAIVSDIPGTTRDIIKATICIEGMTLHLSDTAGIRQSTNVIEQEGIRRTHQHLEHVDLIIAMQEPEKPLPIPMEADKTIIVFNKMDLYPDFVAPEDTLTLSIKTGKGLPALKKALLQKVGAMPSESQYSVRTRHLRAIDQAQDALAQAQQALQQKQGELLAEELKHAANHLGSITGQVLTDDLLGDIFSQFCIGK